MYDNIEDNILRCFMMPQADKVWLKEGDKVRIARRLIN